MTEDQFKALNSHDAWLYLDNAQAQRDDALARIADMETKAADVAKANQKKVDEANGKLKVGQASWEIEKAQIATDHEAAIGSLNAQHKLVIDALNNQLAAAQQLIDSMGGTVTGQKLLAIKRLAEAQAGREAAAAALAEADHKLADAQAAIEP